MLVFYFCVTKGATMCPAAGSALQMCDEKQLEMKNKTTQNELKTVLKKFFHFVFPGVYSYREKSPAKKLKIDTHEGRQSAGWRVVHVAQ